MLQFLISVIIASLFLPTGASFLTERSVDFSYSWPPLAQTGPQRLVNSSLGIETTADAALVVDGSTDAILYAKNNYRVQPVASITKLLTALVALDSNIDLGQVVTITEQDKREGNIVYLLTGEQVTVRDLLFLSLGASSNEATAALARASGIQNFASAMNGYAYQLGMTDSTFVDSTGLEPGNISSAADLIKLGRAAFANQLIAQAITTSEYRFTVTNTGRQVVAYSTDQLLGSFLDRGQYRILGGKTGYLDEAGYCLLVAVQQENGPTLYVTLLGSASQADRWQEAKGLVDWVLRNYQWPAATN